MARISSISARVGVASALHVGVEEEIHGVELVAFATHAHSSGFARGRDRGEVGVDIVLPEADAGEDVRRHVQGVRRGGRDLRVAAGGGQSELRELRLIVGVDQVVGHAGMVGLGGEKFFENRGGLLAIGEGGVVVGFGG